MGLKTKERISCSSNWVLMRTTTCMLKPQVSGRYRLPPWGMCPLEPRSIRALPFPRRAWFFQGHLPISCGSIRGMEGCRSFGCLSYSTPGQEHQLPPLVWWWWKSESDPINLLRLSVSFSSRGNTSIFATSSLIMAFQAQPTVAGVYRVKVYGTDRDCYWKYISDATRWISLQTVDESNNQFNVIDTSVYTWIFICWVAASCSGISLP